HVSRSTDRRRDKGRPGRPCLHWDLVLTERGIPREHWMDSNRDTMTSDDLSSLAWVQEELRKSLDAAHKALRRFLKEFEGASGSDVDDVDPAVLRTARQQLHQGVGALELVGMPAAATL